MEEDAIIIKGIPHVNVNFPIPRKGLWEIIINEPSISIPRDEK